MFSLKAVPTLALSHLSAEDRRAYVLADNKLAINAGWDQAVPAAMRHLAANGHKTTRN